VPVSRLYAAPPGGLRGSANSLIRRLQLPPPGDTPRLLYRISYIRVKLPLKINVVAGILTGHVAYVDVPNSFYKLFEQSACLPLRRRLGFDSQPRHVSIGTSSLGWR
jgi:hypothetical protein